MPLYGEQPDPLPLLSHFATAMEHLMNISPSLVSKKASLVSPLQAQVPEAASNEPVSDNRSGAVCKQLCSQIAYVVDEPVTIRRFERWSNILDQRAVN